MPRCATKMGFAGCTTGICRPAAAVSTMIPSRLHLLNCLVSTFQPGPDSLALQYPEGRAALVLGLGGGPETGAAGIDLGHRSLLQPLEDHDFCTECQGAIQL